jgi:hypothetical protein
MFYCVTRHTAAKVAGSVVLAMAVAERADSRLKAPSTAGNSTAVSEEGLAGRGRLLKGCKRSCRCTGAARQWWARQGRARDEPARSGSCRHYTMQVLAQGPARPAKALLGIEPLPGPHVPHGYFVRRVILAFSVGGW